MPADTGPISLHLAIAEALRNRPSAPETTPRSSHRGWVRWVLFALPPFVVMAGGYWCVTGGQMMSTDDAYVEADKVGILIGCCHVN
jgi:membrane fusion protein (multidrug efflux system)